MRSDGRFYVRSWQMGSRSRGSCGHGPPTVRLRQRTHRRILVKQLPRLTMRPHRVDPSSDHRRASPSAGFDRVTFGCASEPVVIVPAHLGWPEDDSMSTVEPVASVERPDSLQRLIAEFVAGPWRSQVLIKQDYLPVATTGVRGGATSIGVYSRALGCRCC
jgi:hypothetical protein